MSAEDRVITRRQRHAVNKRLHRARVGETCGANCTVERAVALLVKSGLDRDAAVAFLDEAAQP